jgi:hypothetical protein
MRAAILLVVMYAGCLIAPPRPDDGAGEPLDDNGCISDGTLLGLATSGRTATLGDDTLVRVGTFAGRYLLYFYRQAVTNSRCPQEVVELGDPQIASIDALELTSVTTFTGPEELLLLASHTDGTSSVRHFAPVGVEDRFVEVGRVTATIQPAMRETDQGSESLGFIGYRRASQELWFGGGAQGIAIADVSAGFAGEAAVVPVDRMDQAWYFAMPLEHEALDGSRFVLIGDATTVHAHYRPTDPAIVTSNAIVRGDGCVVPSCSAGRRVARLGFPRFSGQVFEGASINRTTGHVESIRTASATDPEIRLHSPDPTGGVVDVAIDAGLNAYVLQAGGQPAVLVYPNFLNSMTPVAPSSSQSISSDASRVVFALDARKLWVLADDPLLIAEHCFLLDLQTMQLVPCP